MAAYLTADPAADLKPHHSTGRSFVDPCVGRMLGLEEHEQRLVPNPVLVEASTAG